MGRPREHAEETREALRAAAEELFEKGGAEAVSVRAVADAAGTTTRAVYSLFGSRDGLLVDALGVRGYELLTQWVLAHPGTDDPADDLVEMSIRVFRRFVVEHPALFRISFQRAVRFVPGPELVAAREGALEALTEKVRRLDANQPLVDAVVTFQAMCEGLGNLELRGAIMRLFPSGEEEHMWRQAMSATVAGLVSPKND